MRSARRLLILSVLATSSAAVACSGDYMTNPFAPMALELFLAPTVKTILVPDTIPSGTSSNLTISATSLGRAIETPKGVVWESADPSVAYFDADGAIFPVNRGTTTVTARINRTRATATVIVAYKATRILVDPATIGGHVGDTLTVTAKAVDSQGSLVDGMAYTFTSADPTTATVTRTGNLTARVTLLKVGTARVFVSSAGQTASVSGVVAP